MALKEAEAAQTILERQASVNRENQMMAMMVKIAEKL
jgi:hypothetical protein